MALVRDAMVRDPVMLEGGDSAQAAGERLADPNVRAVLVCEEGRLIGVVTRKTLVREVVAAGLDPTTTKLRAIAEPPLFTLDAATPLDEAFHTLEERDLYSHRRSAPTGRQAAVIWLDPR